MSDRTDDEPRDLGSGEPGEPEQEPTQPIGARPGGTDRWAPPSGAPVGGPLTPPSPPSAVPEPSIGAVGAVGAAAAVQGPGGPSGPPPSGPPPSDPPATPQPTTPLPMLERPFGAAQRASDRSTRPGVAGWVWPAIAALALVVGLLGGALGGGLVGALTDDDVPGLTDGGLDDVDLETRAPLDKPGSVAQVAQTVLPSTVQILAELDGVEAGATGSGFVLDRNGHIITNNHVIEYAAENDGPIQVVDHEGNIHAATVVGRSPVYDLAVLHVAGGEDLQPAKLGHSRKLRVGEPVVAIGAPLGLSSTVTSGIVSALNRPVTTGNSGDQGSYINAVQTDAAINPGNSGGPLVNLTGEVVGVNSAIATNGGGTVDGDAGNIGVGFAIPVEQVRVTADQILKTGEAQYPRIGARVQTGGPVEFDGATIEDVENNSPAEDAGLEDGDVITHVNGQRVTDGLALIVAIRTYQPNETIELTVERGEETLNVRVRLEGQVG